MDLLVVSMPYAKFDSKWFASVPNINLGMLKGFLSRQGRSVRTFHFHMDFIFHVMRFGEDVLRKFIRLSQEFGVEYLSLDYVFASLLYEASYSRSHQRLMQRLGPIGLNLNDFETFREISLSFIDASFSKLETHLARARLVGFSCSHYQLSGSLLMSLKIKEAFPDLPIVIGGKDVAGPFSRELKAHAHWVDFVALGECEVTVSSILDHLESKSAPLKNVVYKNEGGTIVESEIEENSSLDDFPFPEYDHEDFPLSVDEVILPLELGRGCPWGKCTFCPDQAYHIKCQSKSAEHVMAELDHYQQVSPDLRNFFILDSDALKQPETIIELSKHLRGKELCFHFAEFRAERMNREVVKALLDFGKWVTPFQVGIETFSDRVLKLMEKGVTVLKNVEVLKMVAEMGIPLQFNLFTCYPNMTNADMIENLQVMDAITHILVCENIRFFPGEFYLPSDCPIFANVDKYDVERNNQSLFADMFDGFPMPSYSNYPYGYAFHNHEEQFRMANTIRRHAANIEKKRRFENFMHYKDTDAGLEIEVCREGRKRNYVLKDMEKEIYLFAIENVQRVDDIVAKGSLSAAAVRNSLDKFEDEGLILYSKDKTAYLALAMCRSPH